MQAEATFDSGTVAPEYYRVLAPVSRGCPLPWGRFPCITHPFAAKPGGFSRELKNPPGSARLACLRHAASVSPGPGSNPPSEILLRGIDFPVLTLPLFQRGQLYYSKNVYFVKLILCQKLRTYFYSPHSFTSFLKVSSVSFFTPFNISSMILLALLS